MRKQTFAVLSSVGVALLLAGAGCSSSTPKTTPNPVAEPVPTVSAVDQTIASSTVMVESAFTTEPSWITIHAEANGAPGDVIGETAIPTGASSNVAVVVDQTKVTPVLYAMLHSDLGTVGTYEFPGVDAPTVYKDNVVMVKFSAAIAFMNKDAVTTGTMMKGDDKGTEKTTGTMKKDDTKKTDDGSMKASAQKSFAITAKQFSFDPATITVNKGDAVTLTIKSIDVTHGFSLPDFGVNETLAPGKTVTVKFTADKAGTFSYRCSVMCGAGHMDMKGTLIVK